jgi:quinol monooxygenase YgiN
VTLKSMMISGCSARNAATTDGDPHVLVFVETWENEALWRAHMNGQAMQHFQASGAGKLIQDFALHRLAPIAHG